MKKIKTHVIWSNDYDEIESIAKDLLHEANDPHDKLEDYLDDAYAINNDYLDDERCNLDQEVGRIFAIGYIGTWQGTRCGWKEIGTNIKDCLSSEADIVAWRCENRKFVCEECHHDGTNYIEYRVLKKNTSQKFLTALMYDEVSTDDIIKNTRSLYWDIKHVYGW